MKQAPITPFINNPLLRQGLVWALLSMLLLVVTLLNWRDGLLEVLHTVDIQEISNVVAGELLPDTSIGQTFTARLPGVCRVDIRLATYARTGLQGPVIFRLQRDVLANSPTAVILQADAGIVVDNQFHVFAFAALPNAMGETFYFFLEAPEARPGQAITVWGTRQSEAYAGGKAVLRNLPQSGLEDLAFRVHYCPSFLFSLQVWLRRLTADRPGLFSKPLVYIALFCVYGVVLSWIGLLFFHTNLQPPMADPPNSEASHKSE